MLADVANRGSLPHWPVIVCGAGAGGLAAALAAARCDVEVLLVEAAPNLGGTVASVLIHTIGGLFGSAGELINEGLPGELAERLQAADARTRRRKMGRVWVLQACPNVYREAMQRWIGEEPRITTLVRATVSGVTRVGGKVTQVEVTRGKRRFIVQPRGVVDATGSAAVAALLGTSHLIDEEQRAAGGLIFRLRNVSAGALKFPKGVGFVRALRAAAASGALPPPCRHAWMDAGIDPDEVFVKLLVPLTGGDRSAVFQQDDEQTAWGMQTAAVEFLRQFAEFRDAFVVQTGTLGIRDGGRIAGRYTLTGDDVRAGRAFADAACRCAWPIEYWDAVRGVSIEYLPDGTAYEIPLRCLQLVGIDNYWAAGKCLSADRYAHASARVAGACWAMGQAVGVAAAIGQAAKEEDAGEHEPLRPVSRYGAATTRSPGDYRDPTLRHPVVPGT